MVRLEKVTYSYNGKKTLGPIDLHIKKGQALVLTGKSGSGKTTVTRLINGLAKHFYEGEIKGKVLVNGQDIYAMELWKVGETVGSIFQDPRSQFFASLAEDEVAFGCENYGMDPQRMERRVTEALEEVNGVTLYGREIHPMSSGEKQKLAIASTYAVAPSIYVFDEPSANLDMASVRKLQELMKALKKQGHTLIIAEHRLYYLEDIGDTYVMMRDGQVVEQLSAEQFRKVTIDGCIQRGIRYNALQDVRAHISDRKYKGHKSIDVADLAFSYNKQQVLHNITFQAHEGDIIGIIGENGAGKSTLAHLLCGLYKEDAGSIHLYDRKVSSRKRKALVYFIMQNTDCQLFGIDVEEELALNQTRDEPKVREELLIKYDLIECSKQHPSTLSGGQKQRLTMAVAECMEQKILIYDEPTSGLDGENMRRVVKHMKDMADALNTQLVITHDYEFIIEACHDVLVIRKGCIADRIKVAGNEKRILMLMEQMG